MTFEHIKVKPLNYILVEQYRYTNETCFYSDAYRFNDSTEIGKWNIKYKS